MPHRWDPRQYLAFADERGRPFLDLVGRVRAEAPQTVVDLGCGPGNLTELLAQRWPESRVAGVDSSPEMIGRARRQGGPVTYEVADLRDWLATPGQVDVLVSNATLQWVPDHLELLPALLGKVRPGGWLAIQVPGNFAEPSHTLRAELAATPPYAEHLSGIATPASHDAQTYLRVLHRQGCVVDAWETTYLHVLHGPDPVYEWVLGTGARPTFERLPADLRERFGSEFRRRLRAAYPDEGHGVVLPFRRIFVVAQLPA